MRTAAATNFERAQVMYEPKINTFTAKVWKHIPGYEQQDLDGELLEVLWRCTERYHPDAGGNFNTFFWRSAKNRTISIERHAKALRRSAEWVRLDPDVFVLVVDEILSDFSAEDYAIANLTWFRDIAADESEI